MSSSLLSLYQAILIPILTDWINNWDLCHLDVAVCNLKSRQVFLPVLTKCTIFNITDRGNALELYEWLLLRGMGLSTVSYGGSFDRIRHVNLVSRTPRLFRLNTFGEDDYPSNVKSVKYLRFKGSPESLLSFLENVDGVEHLDLSKCKVNIETGSVDMGAVFSSCPGLKTLTLSSAMKLNSALQLDYLTKINGCNLAHLLNCNQIWGYCDLLRVYKESASTLKIGNMFFIMKKLEIFENLMTTSMLPFINHLETLEVVGYTDPSLFQAITDKCVNLTHLTGHYLSLGSAYFLPLFEKMSQLKQIHLINCSNISRDLLSLVARCCCQLESFSAGCYKTPEHIIADFFDKCPSLMKAVLGYALVGDTLVRKLAVNLKSLTVRSEHPVFIERTADKQQLEIKSKHITGNIDFRRLCGQNPTLTEVDLRGLMQFTACKLKHIIDACPLLTSISLVNCGGVSFYGYQALLSCTHLKRLTLDLVSYITDTFLCELVSTRPCFEKLSLRYTIGFTGPTLTALAKHCPAMRYVDFSRNPHVTSQDVITLLEGCRRLDTLLLAGCGLVDAAIFPTLQTRKQMRQITLPSLRISKEVFEDFKATSGLLCSSFTQEG